MDLRCGNWVCFDEERTLKVTIQDLMDIRRSPELYSGIGITPKFLEKNGFPEINSTMELSVKELWFERRMDILTFTTTDSDIKQIKYVHELQNIYRAITGAELEIPLVDMSMTH